MTEYATLRPVRMEISSPRNGRPGYKWVGGYEVTSPEGGALAPYMRKQDAISFCKSQGWGYVKLER